MQMKKNKQASSDLLSVGPYLQDPQPTSMIIRWVACKHTYSYLEYYESDNAQDLKQVYPLSDGMVEAYAIHCKVLLADLHPKTVYHYRIIVCEILEHEPYHFEFGQKTMTAFFTFQTWAEDPDVLTLLMLNDLHDRPASFEELLALNGKRPFDLVLLAGDLFNYLNRKKQIEEHFLRPAVASFASSTPFIFARGNHECRGRYARELPKYLSNPSSRYYFSLSVGALRLIVLDSGEDKEDDYFEYGGLNCFDAYRMQQAEWLRSEVATDAFQKARFRIVLIHMPIYHGGEKHGNLDCRQLFGPLLKDAGIDLMLSGHTHRYAYHRAEPDLFPYPILIGGGQRDGSRTLIRITIEGSELRYTMMKEDGELIVDEKIIKKDFSE